LDIGETKLVFQTVGKVPVDRDRLYKYNNGIVNTNLQLEKKILGIISGPGLDL